MKERDEVVKGIPCRFVKSIRVIGTNNRITKRITPMTKNAQRKVFNMCCFV